jgi:outer membrane protein
MDHLKRLLGLDLNENVILTDSLGNNSQEVQPAEIKAALSLALANRPEISIQRLQLLKGQQEISHVKAERAPKVWLSGQYQLQAQADDLQLSSINWPVTSFIGAHVAVPIYSGSRLQAKANQARLSLQQHELTLSNMEQKLENELHALINNLQEAQNRLAIQQKTVEVAMLSFKMLEELYMHGMGSRLELTDAELALTQARTHQLQALYQVRSLQLELKLALGILQPIADAPPQEKP